MVSHNWETSLASAFKSAATFISVTNFCSEDSPHAPPADTNSACQRAYRSLKIDIWRVLTMLKSRENGGWWQRNADIHPLLLPPSEQVAFQWCRGNGQTRHCMGYVDTMCDKFDSWLCSENRLPVTADNRFTCFPVYHTIKHSVVKSRWLCYFQESRSTCQKFYFL